MKKLITLILIIASFSVTAQTYKTATMALDTVSKTAILRAGVQSYNLNDTLSNYQQKQDGLVSGGDATIGTGSVTIATANYRINKINYTSSQRTFTGIANSPSGTQYYLVVYGKTSSTLDTISGARANVAVVPNNPINTIKINTILIGDAGISSSQQDLSGYVTTNTNQFIPALKSFGSEIDANGGLKVSRVGTSYLDFKPGDSLHNWRLFTSSASDGDKSFGIQDSSGTDAFIIKNGSRNVEIPSSLKANSFVKSGGTSSQFLKADGSVDAAVYSTQTALNLKANDNAVVHLAGTESITGSKTFTLDVQVPVIPANANSAASKSYIDNAITGITWKAAVRVATTANITLSGTQTIDAIALVVGDRVLVKNQTAQADNGIYLVSSTAWTRPTDADSGAEIETSTVAVTLGTLNKNTQYTCTATAITIGTTPITFTQISGAGTYTSGTGLTLTGNVFAIDGTVATLSGTQTLTNKSISGGQITSAVANATLASTVTTNANLTGDVTSVGNATTYNGVVPVSKGGTGSASQNFVDLTTAQTVAGAKTLTGALTGTSATTAAMASMNIISADPSLRFKWTSSPTADKNTMEQRLIGSGGNEYMQWRTINDAQSVFTTRMALWNSGSLYLGTSPVDNGSGSLTLTGGLTGTSAGFSGKVTLPSGTTASAPLNIANGVSPTTPVQGDIWRLTTGLRTQTFDGTQTKDVIFDKVNSVFAGFGVGAVVTDNLGNLSVAPAADRVIANTDNNTPKTANYTIVLSDYGSNGFGYLGFNSTSGNLTATLPTASTTNGLTFTIKKSDASANTVTLSSAQNIDGVTTKVLSTRYSAITVMSNGSTYNIISQF